MADNKVQDKIKNESNDERDQDEGSMNNGTIGGDIGIPDSSAGNGQPDVSKISKDRESKISSADSKGSAAGK